jgi:hypothetical protein
VWLLLQSTVRDEDMTTIALETILDLVAVNTEAPVPTDEHRIHSNKVCTRYYDMYNMQNTHLTIPYDPLCNPSH